MSYHSVITQVPMEHGDMHRFTPNPIAEGNAWRGEVRIMITRAGGAVTNCTKRCADLRADGLVADRDAKALMEQLRADLKAEQQDFEAGLM